MGKLDLKVGPRRRGVLVTLVAALACTPLCAQQAEQPASQQPQAKKPLDVKSTFRNVCSFCHESYGRKAGKGPQLMNSPKTDQELFNRIKNGMPGRMAAFGSVFTEDQIWDIVKFIRNLKPDQDP
jgi:mono/diheme cytochrome c family protein